MRLKQIQMLLRLTLSSNSFYFLLTQHNKKEQKKSHTKRRFKKKKRALAESTYRKNKHSANPSVTHPGIFWNYRWLNNLH